VSAEDDAARAVVDAAAYMTLATADATGRPWASPVWFATADRREFVWASKPGAQHSRNLAQRPEVSIVVFDTGAPLGTGGGVYLAAVAGEVDNADLERCVDAFSRKSQAQGGGAFTADEVREPAALRMYRAIVTEAWLGTREDQRVPVELVSD
jgi:pyridoxine/pyridoxamine 5'-phosphate oxidase